MKKYIFIITFVILFSTFLSASENEIANLVKNLDKLDTKLYSIEFQLDGYYKEYSKFDGVGGWFNGLFSRKAKKKLEKNIKQKEDEISSTYSEMGQIERTIQKKMYDVAFSYEKNGDYSKAIEWYLKLSNINNDVKYRIATCYKLDKKYSKAIKWFMDISASDTRDFEIANTYELWGKLKESVSWYIEVISNFDNSKIEIKALNKVETISYSQKLSDFPTLYQILSDTYVRKAFLNHDSNIGLAKKDFVKAAEFLSKYSNLNSVKAGANAIVTRYKINVDNARHVLDEQRYHAEDFYQQKLNNAKYNYDQACRRYDEALRRAEDNYYRKLKELDAEHKKYKKMYEQYKTDGKTPEEIQSALKWANDYKKKYEELQRPYSHERFVQNNVRYEKQERENANSEYQRMVNSRRQIIEDYLRPYKRKVNDAEKEYNVIQSLYSMSSL